MAFTVENTEQIFMFIIFQTFLQIRSVNGQIIKCQKINMISKNDIRESKLKLQIVAERNSLELQTKHKFCFFLDL